MGQVQEVRHTTLHLLARADPQPYRSAGPIIEQGTHFCDLSRYFGGDVDISTVVAHSLEWDEPAGKLSQQKIDESKIAPENRISRITSATWKYQSGAVGTFTHLTALQGHDYSCELEVYADGYQLKCVLSKADNSTVG